MEVERNFGSADRESSYYQYVPFSVPEGWRSVAVELCYDRTSAVLDLGLLGPGGFRGWSGGERKLVHVAERWATPGYLPGRLAGEWSVILGLYQVSAQGVRATVSVGPGPAEPPPAKAWPPVPSGTPALARPPARPGHLWVAGDFHCHSEHSDGTLSLPELAALARRRGLDFLAVTDHNTVSHFPHLEAAGLRYGVTLVAGQEVTTPEGHANCIGKVQWADFRTSPDEWMAKAGSEGGLSSLNHPVFGSLSWRMPLSGPPELMELWHASWDRASGEVFQFWASAGAPVPVGGSDFHRPGDMDATGSALWPGAPTTWVEVEADGRGGAPSPASIIEGLRAGSVAISRSPGGPLVIRRGDDVVVTGGAGATIVVVEDPLQPLGEGRRLAVREERASFPVGAGTALLVREGKVVALCP